MYKYTKIWHIKVGKVYIYIRMDAPNAPNPANQNEQDQNADVAQGPTNQSQGPVEQDQAQGPTVQNQAQVPPAQIPIQVPVAQIPIQGPTKIGQNIPVQPLLQLVLCNWPLLVL